VSRQAGFANSAEVIPENRQKSAWELYLSVWKKYAVFEGRAQRAEYWYFVLFQMLFSILVVTIFPFEFAITVIGLYFLAAMLPGFGVIVRRLHDTGKSGWMYWITLIPLIGSIWLLVLMTTDSDPGRNRYGLNPKGIGN
jgi:uncharacterized membrane protein YhaH (DUF805 family)